MHLHDWLKKNGFAPFSTLSFTSYEDKLLNEGGTRIEIVDDVATVWNPSLSFYEYMYTDAVQACVEMLLWRRVWLVASKGNWCDPIVREMVKAGDWYAVADWSIENQCNPEIAAIVRGKVPVAL